MPSSQERFAAMGGGRCRSAGRGTAKATKLGLLALLFAAVALPGAAEADQPSGRDLEVVPVRRVGSAPKTILRAVPAGPNTRTETVTVHITGISTRVPVHPRCRLQRFLPLAPSSASPALQAAPR